MTEGQQTLCLQQISSILITSRQRGGGVPYPTTRAALLGTRFEGLYEHDYEGYPDTMLLAPKHAISCRICKHHVRSILFSA